MIASCGFLEEELRQFSKVEGVTLAGQCGNAWSRSENKSFKRLGAKEKARRIKCNVRFSFMKNNRAFRKNYLKVGVKKLLRAGMMPARTCGAHTVRMSPTESLKLRRQMAAAAG